ncbi:integrase core domain-containing protein [Actinosynnema sp. NPDC053489]|uniref:integrase core domain-containing protein n=1 Tax=Actinosynnema sp. NPDC053489 TaxID=3363916 RepID=UPI0037C6FF68
MTRSMGAVGSSADNAAAESPNASFERETRQGAQARCSAGEARLAVFGRAHRHNTRRRHSHPGRKSPIGYENSLLPTPAALTHAAQPRVRHPG